MSIIEEQYMDATVEQPPFDDTLLGDATTVTDLSEDRRLTLQGLEEAEELGFLVSAEARARWCASPAGRSA